MLMRRRRGYPGSLRSRSEGDYDKLEDALAENKETGRESTFDTSYSETKTNKPRSSFSKLLSLPRRISLESKQAPHLGNGYSDLGSPLETRPCIEETGEATLVRFGNTAHETKKEGSPQCLSSSSLSDEGSPRFSYTPSMSKEVSSGFSSSLLSEEGSPRFSSTPPMSKEESPRFSSTSPLSPRFRFPVPLSNEQRVSYAGDSSPEAGMEMEKERAFEVPDKDDIDTMYPYQGNHAVSVPRTKARNTQVARLLSMPRRISGESKYPMCLNIGYNELGHEGEDFRAFHSQSNRNFGNGHRDWDVPHEVVPTTPQRHQEIGQETMSFDPFLSEKHSSDFHCHVSSDDKPGSHSSYITPHGEDLARVTAFQVDEIDNLYPYQENHTGSAPRTKTRHSQVAKLMSMPRRITGESKYPLSLNIGYNELQSVSRTLWEEDGATSRTVPSVAYQRESGVVKDDRLHENVENRWTGDECNVIQAQYVGEETTHSSLYRNNLNKVLSLSRSLNSDSSSPSCFSVGYEELLTSENNHWDDGGLNDRLRMVMEPA